MLSVIMAVYNGERHLNEAVCSILAQTYTDFELIIVNDGSTDHTKQILDSYSHEERVNVIHLNNNQGAANALNIAVEHSRGDWIVIHDADDVSLPTRLEDQHSFLRNQDNISAVGTLIECINGDPPLCNEKLLTIEQNYNGRQTADDIMNIRYYGNPICHGTMMFSKEMFHLVGGYNQNYKIAYDYDLWMRFMQEKPIVKIPKVLYKWRVYKESLHRKNEGDTCNEVLRISSQYIKNSISTYHNSANVVVIGSKSGCKNYQRVIQHLDGFRIQKYLVNPPKTEIRNLCKSISLNELNGVIVLESKGCYKFLNYLLRGGLIKNHNLFFLWNVF